jgi:hypothetical protein
VTTPFVVVPALTAVHDNTIRRDLLDPYAARAAASWVDAFLLSGPPPAETSSPSRSAPT